MKEIQSYKDLIVWQKGIDLVSEIYILTKQYPRDELYGIISQTRRAAVSIPANIAEGHTRGHRLEYIQFLRIAFGSGAELETRLIIAKKLGFVSEADFQEADDMLNETMRMLNTMIHSLSSKP